MIIKKKNMKHRLTDRHSPVDTAQTGKVGGGLELVVEGGQLREPVRPCPRHLVSEHPNQAFYTFLETRGALE